MTNKHWYVAAEIKGDMVLWVVKTVKNCVTKEIGPTHNSNREAAQWGNDNLSPSIYGKMVLSVPLGRATLAS